MDDEIFRAQVQTALAHLYDDSFLESHPLARAMRGRIPSGDCGRALRRLIVDTIQDLKPQRGAGEDSAGWRNYKCLYLRYVEPRPVVEIARDLYVSDRQERRRHRVAVEALCALLRQRWNKLVEGQVKTALEDDSTDRTATESSDDSALETELDRIEMARAAEVVDLRDAVDSAVATATRLAEIRGVTIASQKRPSRILAIGNRVVLRQALLGALVYAIHTADDGQVSVDISSDSADCLVSIRVASAAAVGARREEDTAEGGLIEPNRLLKTQRGSIDVVTDDSGASVQVRVPQARVRTVLIVDDSADLLELFRRYLKGSMYEPVEATSGEEALVLAQKVRPACIILDVMMPSRDGWDILQSLRSDQATRGLPVVVCSVLRQRELALSLGAVASLIKPVTQRALLEALDRYSLTAT